MYKFDYIIANTIDEVYIGVTSTGQRHVMSKSGFEAWMFFANKDDSNSYDASDISLMIQMLTHFQYHWLDKRSNFKAYGKKHHDVLNYIFDHYDALKGMRINDLKDKLYQIFK
jgi:hypothetical protein